MKRSLIGLCLLIALATAACAGPAVQAEPVPPPAQTPIFHGLGQLAYVHDGKLYLLDGEAETTREVAGAAPAINPSWSADGRWLAFWRTEGNQSHLLVADSATATARELQGLSGKVTGFAWAPAGSALAVTLTVDGHAGTSSEQLAVLPDPSQSEHQILVRGSTPLGALHWSPDGSRIAYVTTLPFTDVTQRDDAVEVVPVAGGPAERWYTAVGAGIDLAGWAPDGQRLLLWVRPMHCNSCAADGLPLQSLARGAKEPVTLVHTLLNPRWLSWHHADLALVQGGGRIAWDMKNLAVCHVAEGTCRTLPQEPNAVSLDPAWAPDGSKIAFVKAARRPGEWGFSGQEAIQSWVDSHTLWLVGPDGAGEQAVTAAGTGIYSPAWARDGRHILYVRENALWIVDLEQERAEQVARLTTDQEPFGFYGQRSWSHLYAWYSGN